ncbi:hypothetical protein A8L34_04180 [Bacillus sp. FJAT-27264]|nr:hypothetical protein A8L34_04180 [Bacillus sp. FJAT-27264]
MGNPGCGAKEAFAVEEQKVIKRSDWCTNLHTAASRTFFFTEEAQPEVGTGTFIDVEAIMLNGAGIGEYDLVGAGFNVTENKRRPENTESLKQRRCIEWTK